jgi:zinc protease
LVAGYFLSKIVQVRLRKRLREDLGGVYSVGFSGGDHVYPYNYYSFNLSFGCDPSRLDELYAETLQLLTSVHTEDFLEEEIENTRQQLMRSYDEQLRKNKSWMNHLITAIQRKDTPDRIFRYIEAVKNMKKEDIHAFAKKTLNLQHRLSLFWLPSESSSQNNEEGRNLPKEVVPT